MDYCSLLIVVTLWTALLARVGSRDTFCYKKSKTTIRKDLANLTWIERLLAKLGVEVNEALVFVSSYNLFFPVYV